MYSLSSKSSNFTVSTGGKTFVAPGTPLGVSTYEIVNHFISPVPPVYVSEYQDKFKWPALRSRSTKISSVYDIPKDISIPFRQHNQWQNLLRVIDQLLKKDYEPNLLRTLREQVAARRFDSLLEFATAHFHDVVNAEQPKLDAQVDLSGGQNGHESVATSANIVGLPEDILRLCKEFLECVAAIKEA